MVKKYRADLDFLKGFAIISVILYHMGIVKSGYLGVDLFFVINGMLIIPKLIDSICSGANFSYWGFIKRRLSRLYPLIVIASLICLAIGYIGMIPDDYENVAENVIATNLMSTNILSAITIGDYWNVRTQYQPLMHMWFVGILVEFYVVIPLILLLTRSIAKRMEMDIRKTIVCVLGVLCLISLFIYLSPATSDSTRFYGLPSRFFELTFGGVILYNNTIVEFVQKLFRKYLYGIIVLLLFLIICVSTFSMDWNYIGVEVVPVGAENKIAASNIFLLPRPLCLLLVVFLSILCVIAGENCKNLRYGSILCHVGKISFSLFIWHQIMLAYYRYFYSDNVTPLFVALFLIILYVLSYLSYNLIEKTFKSNKSLFFIILLSVITCLLSFAIYNNAGVVRDVPELDAYVTSAKRGMHSNYVDRVNSISKPFEDNGKINVLLKGNSFARDFANVILESKYGDKVNILKIADFKEIDYKVIKQCDFAFIFSNKRNIPSFVWANIDSSRVYGIGTKTFGDSNGIIYKHRNSENYFSQTIEPRKEYLELNKEWSDSWGDHYINLMEMSMDENNRVRVFTPEHKLISQDCKHLTKAGAIYFAKIVDFDKIFNR